MGGENRAGWEGNDQMGAYYINDKGNIVWGSLEHPTVNGSYSLYTLEEYEALQLNLKGLGENKTDIWMKYKAGDRVKLVDSYPTACCKDWLGKVVTIDTAKDGFYTTLEIRSYFLTEDMIEGLVEEAKPKDMGEVSDGYHTFNELYEYRMLYNAALFNEFAKQGLYDVHKSRKHSDGEYPFGDSNWFIVMAELPTGQISNHYEMKDWNKFKIPEKPLANKWDEHSPRDVADRLTSFTTPKKEYPKTYDYFVSLVKRMREAQDNAGMITGEEDINFIDMLFVERREAEREVDEYLEKMEK